MSIAVRIKNVLEVGSSVALIVAAMVLVWTLALRETPGQQQVESIRGLISADRVTNVLGTGRVAIVEFSDFQCPFCAKHARETMPILHKTFVDVGDVRLVSMNYWLAAIREDV